MQDKFESGSIRPALPLAPPAPHSDTFSSYGKYLCETREQVAALKVNQKALDLDQNIIAWTYSERSLQAIKMGKMYYEFQPGGKGSFTLAIYAIDPKAGAELLVSLAMGRYQSIELDTLVPFSPSAVPVLPLFSGLQDGRNMTIVPHIEDSIFYDLKRYLDRKPGTVEAPVRFFYSYTTLITDDTAELRAKAKRLLELLTNVNAKIVRLSAEFRSLLQVCSYTEEPINVDVIKNAFAAILNAYDEQSSFVEEASSTFYVKQAPNAFSMTLASILQSAPAAAAADTVGVGFKRTRPDSAIDSCAAATSATAAPSPKRSASSTSAVGGAEASSSSAAASSSLKSVLLGAPRGLFFSPFVQRDAAHVARIRAEMTRNGLALTSTSGPLYFPPSVPASAAASAEASSVGCHAGAGAGSSSSR